MVASVLGEARHGREGGSTSLAWKAVAGVLWRERRHEVALWVVREPSVVKKW